MAGQLPTPAGVGGAVSDAARRRRTFAIISHPDAGKTTLTEKLLLYGGAVSEAGAVKARRGQREVTSDWMEMERRRGISITSTVLRFSEGDTVFNLLDTPGHRDFSEDTLRVLAAADCAVMLLDAAKGVEPQTLRLFEVARARAIPLITFVNKYDRPGMGPLAMIDHIQDTLDVVAAPLTWPVGEPGDFRGVVDRRDGRFHRFARTARGATMAPEEIVGNARAAAEEGPAWHAAQEELDLLDAVDADFDPQAFAAGLCSPVFFGSAVSNFGVRLLLDALTTLAPAPRAAIGRDGTRRPLEAPFSALVFKVQANMDPRHRDRVAFMRVCSGRFERGMKAINARTERSFTMNYAHEVFGQAREVVEEAFPGDVIGVVNALDLRVGDTLYLDEPVSYPEIPTVAPEHFVVARNRDAARRKQFRKGLQQLGEEGVVQVLHRTPGGDPTPVLGAVGPLQFDVCVARMANEFGVDVALDPLDYTVARRVDVKHAPILRRARNADVLMRADGTPIAVFKNEFALRNFEQAQPDVPLHRLMIDA